MNRWIPFVIAVLLVGCDAVIPEFQGVRYFAALQTEVPSTRSLTDPGPNVSESEAKIYQPIVEGFRQNHAMLLRREDVKEQLERIENVYVATGRYLELVGIYQNDYKEHGASSHVAERLAWAYIRLGQQRQSEEVVASLKAARPNEAMPYFLEGTRYLQWDPTSDDSKQKLLQAWTRVLEIDPNFLGFENITASQIRNQVERLRQEVSIETQPTAMELAQEQVAMVVEAPEQLVPAPEQLVPGVDETLETNDDKTVESPETNAPAAEVEKVPGVIEDPQKTYRVAVARGEVLLNDVRYQEAEDAFLEAKKIDPDGFGAEFGQLRAGWGLEKARPVIRQRLAALSAREDLTARQSYDLGMFFLNHVQDSESATNLFRKVKTMDPALAERVGLERLLTP
jgi:tetratricopeptide (TPR) repeat protein